jgi:hypothetical protein
MKTPQPLASAKRFCAAGRRDKEGEAAPAGEASSLARIYHLNFKAPYGIMRRFGFYFSKSQVAKFFIPTKFFITSLTFAEKLLYFRMDG